MKLSSMPVAAKVGGAGVLGGGGIAGTGLLIHNQLQKTSKSEDLDKELIEETEASLVLDGEINVVSDTKKEVIVKVKASSQKANSKFKDQEKPRWTCWIKGFVKGDDAGDWTTSAFEKGKQKSKFDEKLGTETSKQQYKNKFVENCKNNRENISSSSSGTLTSILLVELKKPTSGDDTNKYAFPDEELTKIFTGTYTNPTDLK